MFAGLLVGIWVARYLGPNQFGLFSYSIAFASIFSSIAKLGLDGVVVRDLVRYPSRRDLYMGTAFWLKLMGAGVMLAIMAFAVQLTSNDATTSLYIIIIASGTVFQSFEVVDFYFQSKVLSKFVSICKLVQLFISSLLKLYLIFANADLIWFVVVTLVDQITLSTAFCIAYRHQRVGGFYNSFDFEIGRKFLVNGWPLIISSFIIMIYMRIDQVMIKEMLGEKEVGLYSAASRVSEVWYFIPVLITNSLFPSIVNAKEKSIELYYLRLNKLYFLMFWMAVVIALPVTFFSKFIINIMYGEYYGDAANVLVVQIWAGIFVFIGVASSKWFISEGLQKYLTFNTMAGAILNVFLNLILIPKFGIVGSAIATIASQSVASYFMNLFFKDTRFNFIRLTRSPYLRFK